MQQVATIPGGVIPHLQPTRAHVKRGSGVQLILHLGVERSRVLIRVYSVTPGEITLALLAVLITPAHLPPVTLTMLGGREKPGLPSAMFPARSITRAGVALVPAVIDAHAATSCCWRNQAMTSAGSYLTCRPTRPDFGPVPR